jgi:CBS domain-containing protein
MRSSAHIPVWIRPCGHADPPILSDLPLRESIVSPVESAMPVGEICNRDVVVTRREDTILAAAKLMRQHHVGDVVVVDERGSVRVPVGIVTDRDLVIEIMATELDQKVMTVGDIMIEELVTIKESLGVFEAIQYMRAEAIRRLPVVDEQGALAGILTLDDLLQLLSEELAAIARLITSQQQKESGGRR